MYKKIEKKLAYVNYNSLMSTLLNLFLLNTDKTHLLCGVNFSMIKNITCEVNKSKTKYEHYDVETNTYVTKYTEPESKFVFKIDIDGIGKPIYVECLNSGKLSKSDMSSYRNSNTLEYLDEVINYSGMEKFIKYLSKNNLSHIMQYFGFILGHIVNNNIVVNNPVCL